MLLLGWVEYRWVKPSDIPVPTLVKFGDSSENTHLQHQKNHVFHRDRLCPTIAVHIESNIVTGSTAVMPRRRCALTPGQTEFAAIRLHFNPSLSHYEIVISKSQKHSGQHPVEGINRRVISNEPWDHRTIFFVDMFWLTRVDYGSVRWYLLIEESYSHLSQPE